MVADPRRNEGRSQKRSWFQLRQSQHNLGPRKEVTSKTRPTGRHAAFASSVPSIFKTVEWWISRAQTGGTVQSVLRSAKLMCDVEALVRRPCLTSNASGERGHLRLGQEA